MFQFLLETLLFQPKFKKAPTPPQSGMKFGEYEDFRKKVEQQRKDEYRSELEKVSRIFHTLYRYIEFLSDNQILAFLARFSACLNCVLLTEYSAW